MSIIISTHDFVILCRWVETMSLRWIKSHYNCRISSLLVPFFDNWFFPSEIHCKMFKIWKEDLTCDIFQATNFVRYFLLLYILRLEAMISKNDASLLFTLKQNLTLFLIFRSPNHLLLMKASFKKCGTKLMYYKLKLYKCNDSTMCVSLPLMPEKKSLRY